METRDAIDSIRGQARGVYAVSLRASEVDAAILRGQSFYILRYCDWLESNQRWPVGPKLPWLMVAVLAALFLVLLACWIIK